MQAEFDLLTDGYGYRVLHKKNIAITCESPEYFVEYKIVDLAELLNRLQLLAINILDFGRGIGNSLPYFCKHFSGSEISCVDISTCSIEITQSSFSERENYVQVDTNISLPTASQDVVCSVCVFRHIPHEEHLHWLAELCRINKPGRVLAIYEHNALNPLTMHAINTCPHDINAKLIGGISKRTLAGGWMNVRVTHRFLFPAMLAALHSLVRHFEWLVLSVQSHMLARKSL